MPGLELELPGLPQHEAEEFDLDLFRRLFCQLVHYFRYGEIDLSKKSDTIWLTYRRIATLLSVPERVVKGVLDGEPPEQVFRTMNKRASRQLTAKHIEFLRHQSVLAEWRTLSLDARRVAFQQYFPGKLLSRRKLRSVYRKCGVRKRVLKDEIYLTPKQIERQT